MNSDFDAKAPAWDEDPRKRDRAATIARQIRARIPLNDSMRVLEYGCGTGLLGFELLNQVGHITFADSSQGMLNQVKRKLSHVGMDRGETLLLQENQLELPRHYDLILSLMTLHHVKDVSSTLKTLTKHLEFGGYLAISDLDPEDGSFHDGQGGVHPGFERGALIHLLALQGLTDFASSTAYEIRETKEDSTRNYPLFLITGKKP